jgi:Mitochondrial ribosomal death-associated protein 3
MYLPDGDRLRKNGFFVTPNLMRDGMYDLQDLSQEACAAFLAYHGKDIEEMKADKATMEKFFKEAQLSKIEGYSGEGIALVDLLQHAAERKLSAPMCFSVVVDTLMNQTEKPFLMVFDEFNCYFDRGHYFHMSYDDSVREAIPYDRINLFEHALGAMALSADAESEVSAKPKLMKKGAIIVGVSHSRSVPRKVTEGLTQVAMSQAASDDTFTVVEVPRFSDIEVDHILANFEAIGLGNMRHDRGDTVMDEQEVAYLKMVSGAIGQKLLDASVL